MTLVCRRCGCTSHAACDLGELGSCWWVTSSICSKCVLEVCGKPKLFAQILEALLFDLETERAIWSVDKNKRHRREVRRLLEALGCGLEDGPVKQIALARPLKKPPGMPSKRRAL